MTLLADIADTCDRVRNGVVAGFMRRTRASYHYTVRRAKQNEELVVRECIANACMHDPSRSFRAKVKKIRHGNTGNT